MRVIQLSIFTKDMWENEMKNIIKNHKYFFPSDIRKSCCIIPPSDNNYGTFYKTLLEQKKIRRTGKYRKSIYKSRRGGIEWEYEVISI